MTRRATAESLPLPFPPTPEAPVSGPRTIVERGIGWPTGSACKLSAATIHARALLWLRTKYPDEKWPEPDMLVLMTPKSIHATLARTLLRGAAGLTWMDLAVEIGEEYGVTSLEIVSRCRSKTIAAARHHFWGALRGAGYSLPEIRRVLGVDPASVRHGVKRRGKELGIT